ncbi:MAG: TIGR02597 family protein [Chthoniobacterales bacterium]
MTRKSLTALERQLTYPAALLLALRLRQGSAAFVMSLGLLVFASLGFAQTVVTNPVGFTTTSCLSNSDTLVSTPFTRPPAFLGSIASIVGSTLTVSGSPGWATNQFVYVQGTQPNHYYALLGPATTTNPKEGHTFTITANTASTLTVDTTSDDLTGVPANAQIVIIPYWTPATLFPASNAGVSFTPTTSPPAYTTLLRVPNYSATGINLPYSAEYYFYGGSWQRISPAGIGDDDPLLPDGYLVVRNANGALTLPLTNLGAVLLKKISVPLATAASPGQDNPVGMVRPVNVALDATGLGSAIGPSDQLLLFDNTQAAYDKMPSATYYYDTHWRLTGDASMADRGSDIIPQGAGFIVRRIGGTPAFWTNAFPVAATGAVSRMVHNGTPYDVNLPLGGAPGIECRSGGASNSYQIILSFPTLVTYTGVSITSGTGSIGDASGSGTAVVTVNLTGATNAQYVTVTLAGVSDGTNTNDVAARMGILIGDTNGDGAVNAGDIGQTKSQSGQPVTAANFREDVTVDGSINAGDIGLVKSKSGTGLP